MFNVVYKYSNSVLFHDCDYVKKWYSCKEQLINDRLSVNPLSERIVPPRM